MRSSLWRLACSGFRQEARSCRRGLGAHRARVTNHLFRNLLERQFRGRLVAAWTHGMVEILQDGVDGGSFEPPSVPSLGGVTGELIRQVSQVARMGGNAAPQFLSYQGPAGM